MKPEEKIIESVNKRNLSPFELETILKSLENKPKKKRGYLKDYAGKRVRIGVFSDLHIGEKHFDADFFEYMGDVFRNEKLKKLYCAGDVLEGMSGREGQIYELAQIGFSNQINYVADLFKKHLKGFQIFGINGNHDAWYMKKNNGGVNVGEELEKRVGNYHHLGDEEANIKLAPNVSLRLFHPNDGTAYAVSYKLQKLIESFDADTKPNILLEGHYHKAMYMFLRNVHGFECGTLCDQTKWMRGKKIPAHKGFWVLDFDINKDGVGRMNHSFYPGYK